MSLIELLVVCSIFISISTVTFLLYNESRAIMLRSSSRFGSEQSLREAVGRTSSLVQSAYTPPISSSYLRFYENPQVTLNNPFPAGVTSGSFLSTTGPGPDSILFYACTDLVDLNQALYPIYNNDVTIWNPYAGPKLYELRLDHTYAVDSYAAYQPDQAAVAGPAPLVMRPLVLREMLIPPHNVDGSANLSGSPSGIVQYLVPPAIAGGNPTGSDTPVATTPTRVVARGLSDCRFWLPQGNQLTLCAYAQDREGTQNNARGRFINTTVLPNTVFLLTP